MSRATLAVLSWCLLVCSNAAQAQRVRRAEVRYDVDGASLDWTTHRAALLASGPWRQPPSVEWAPSASVRAAHEAFVRSLSAMFIDEGRNTNVCNRAGVPTPTVASMTLFFRFTDRGDVDNEVAPRARQFAVSGGRLLIIAERLPDGRWVAAHVLDIMGTGARHPSDSYRPAAVFDMDDDGWPEIVYHEKEGGGEFYGDAVLSRTAQQPWGEVARSPGGSTA